MQIVHFQVKYDTENKVCGIEIDAHMLESNRICAGSYANFHVFFHLFYGAPTHLRLELSLESEIFSVSKQILSSFQYYFQLF